MSTEQFALDKSRFGEVQKKILLKSAPLMVLALLAGGGINYFNNGGRQDQPNVLFVMLPLGLILLAVGMYRGVQRQKGLFLSYRLHVDEWGITREQATTPTIRLESTEIREIHKAADGSYAVKGGSINHTIFIPAQVENPAALEEIMGRFSPLLTPPPQAVATRALQLLPVATVVLLVLVYVSASKPVVAVSGTLLLGFMGYSLVATQRSKHVDGKTKKGIWLVLIVIASVVAVMYVKLRA
ncbi:hypothetical protein ACFQ48_10380 [Hymenobacter caeli]|uniref:PH domain-containing protein n=1 Tax=Hymenobacter caeli TaxID=2735894 RepID=A0ABX2FTE7_9BACT|nr:hypothetical protein [Hymenobacter caeli]NRT19749.1 hypothetical protein [Hymenobacter caeli]